jgi:hypothetical protein
MYVGALADVGAEKAKWMAGRPLHSRTARDSHATDVSKLATPPPVLGRVPTKFSRELTELMVSRPGVWAARPPSEPIWPLAWPNTFPPVLEPMNFIIFDF